MLALTSLPTFFISAFFFCFPVACGTTRKSNSEEYSNSRISRREKKIFVWGPPNQGPHLICTRISQKELLDEPFLPYFHRSKQRVREEKVCFEPNLFSLFPVKERKEGLPVLWRREHRSPHLSLDSPDERKRETRIPPALTTLDPRFRLRPLQHNMREKEKWARGDSSDGHRFTHTWSVMLRLLFKASFYYLLSEEANDSSNAFENPCHETEKLMLETFVI